MNKTELIAAMSAQTGFTKKDIASVVDALTSVIGNALASGDSVKINGFGAFSVTERAARKGRRPTDGMIIDIPASKAPKFKPSSALKELVNN